jgi:protein-L-isoaspartate(D-aspartate) O-methyltransferase
MSESRKLRICLAALLAVVPLATVGTRCLDAQSQAKWDEARAGMVEKFVQGAGVTDPRVLDAMRATPRHEFVDPQFRDQAYFDMALPIGFQQTISSPFIVAFMTECVDPQPEDKVLEIGTGSGYQAAVLSPLVKEVYTIEIVEELGARAKRTLERLKYENVFTKTGDGFLGWEEHAPFDKIVVTCSPEKPPQPLIDQLADGGLIVIPVGERYQQTLYLLRKRDGKLQSEALRPTLFVPMTGVAEGRREVKPDPANPRLINGGFEQRPDESGFVPGWYYQRQLSWETSDDAPEGRHWVTFENGEFRRAAHLLQGFPVDGREVAHLELSASVRSDRVLMLPFDASPGPTLVVTFYDESRRDLGSQWIGPFRGTRPWQSVRKRIRVPFESREAILRIGLFGATGRISFDDVQMHPLPR